MMPAFGCSGRVKTALAFPTAVSRVGLAWGVALI